MEEISSFGVWVKQRRKVFDVTQAELAQRLGCATVTLQKIELDERRPSKHLAARLADVLDVSPAERPTFLRCARGEVAMSRMAVETLLGGVDSSHPCHNLPAQLTSFIGREHVVHLVCTLLEQDDVRLLTLMGPGGTGKTRVGLKLAANVLAAFADGVWFIDLASIRDPAVVPSAIATVLGVRDVPGEPLADRLGAFLAPRHLLLFLDNFEQVLAAGPLLANLLAAAPRLKVLVTSRSVLGVYGEQIFAIPPLTVSTATLGLPLEQVAHTEAIALFLARARTANPDFTLTATNVAAVADLCQYLDGLPLAIELAAARSRLIPPQMLLHRLSSRLQLLTGGPRTLPIRQQTLRATLDWSYDLLTPAEQLLFRRLAVFEGGWTLEAAEQICTTDALCPLDIVDGLASLNDKSLLRVGTTPDGVLFCSMLETIHEYALEHLVATDEVTTLRERHAHFYVGWLEAMHIQYQRGQRDEGVACVRGELRNLATTVTWIIAHGTWDLALRWEESTSSFAFVERLGYLSHSWKRWYQELTDSRAVVSLQTLAAGLVSIGRFAYWQEDLAQAASLLTEGLALARTLDDSHLIVTALEWLGHAYRDQDLYTQAAPLYAETMARAQACGTPFAIASAHHCLGECALLQEDYPRALAQAQASLPFFRALHVQWGIACALIHQGFAALHLGDTDLAARCFPEALRVAQRYSDGSHIRGALAGFVALSIRVGTHNVQRVAHLIGAIAEGTMVYAHRRAYERIVTMWRAQCDATAWAIAYDEGRCMTLEQAVVYALASAD